MSHECYYVRNLIGVSCSPFLREFCDIARLLKSRPCHKFATTNSQAARCRNSLQRHSKHEHDKNGPPLMVLLAYPTHKMDRTDNKAWLELSRGDYPNGKQRKPQTKKYRARTQQLTTNTGLPRTDFNSDRIIVIERGYTAMRKLTAYLVTIPRRQLCRY